MMNKITLAMLSLLILSGCTSLNSNFDCAKKPGGVCDSLGEVNKMVDRGELGKSKNTEKIAAIPTPDIGSTPYMDNTNIYPKPLRAGENIIRVWLAPFEDDKGYYHQASELFVVTRSGRWLGTAPTLSKG